MIAIIIIIIFIFSIIGGIVEMIITKKILGNNCDRQIMSKHSIIFKSNNNVMIGRLQHGRQSIAIISFYKY